MKKLLFGVATATLLWAGYTEDLMRYLASKSFHVNGKFYAYDFDRNGRIDPNDWIYVSNDTGAVYRLLATRPNAQNAFGFAPIAKPADIDGKLPDGYFVWIQFPQDTLSQFSWVYITHSSHRVYKLMGSTPQNRFLYLDIDGNGTPDPLPATTANITDGSVRFVVTNLPGVGGGSQGFSSESSHSYSSSSFSYSSSSSIDDEYENSSYYTSSSSSMSSNSSQSSSSVSDSSYSSTTSSVSADIGSIVRDRGYKLLAWNDLGMHCMDSDYSIFSILPPYNTLNAHLIRMGGEPKKITSGVEITYESFPSLAGKLNTYSAGKTNFWDYSALLYGQNLAFDVGFHGFRTPSLTPQALHYDSQHRWWAAEGIPITPWNDDGSYNPYQMVKVTAKDQNGNILAQTVTVLPVSTEMDCRKCHGSNSGVAKAEPARVWVNLADSEKDFRFNILRLHDEKHPNAVSGHLQALQSKGYNYDTAGLEKTAQNGTPILCAACHKSNALPGTGIAGIPPLTQAIHSKHAYVKDPQSGQILNDLTNTTACYMCHPGSKTQCLRGAMGKNGISCQDCHGTMSAVGKSGRDGWLDEPNCQSCHQNGRRYQKAVVDMMQGTLRAAVDNRFATNPNTLMARKSLYRYSKGHGGLTCSACHGSTHAIYPSAHQEDNLAAIIHQGHSGTIAECTSCHSTVPRTTNKGPHGMHGIGSWWVEAHGDYAEHNTASCKACHGSDYRGSDLSKTFSARTFNTEFGYKSFPAGHKVSCYDCHNGPGGGEDD